MTLNLEYFFRAPLPLRATIAYHIFLEEARVKMKSDFLTRCTSVARSEVYVKPKNKMFINTHILNINPVDYVIMHMMKL